MGLQVGLSGFSMVDMISVSAGAAICNRIAFFLAKRIVMHGLGASSSLTNIVALGRLKVWTNSVCSGCFWRFLLSERQHRQCFSWLAAYSVAKHVASVNGVADGWTEKFTNGGRRAKT